MKCRRCGSEIKVSESESLISFTNIDRANTRTATVCEKCSLAFVEWFANGNPIQKKINQEELLSCDSKE